MNLRHLKNTVVDGEYGDVKGASAEVEDQDVLLAALFVQTVRNGSGCGLIDDARDIQARNST